MLGVLHGPAELLPISSSAHVTLVPWLLGWRYGELDGEFRKTFEVALHAGGAVGLVLGLRREIASGVRGLDRHLALALALACVPAGVAGLLAEGPIEQRLGGPRSIAAGLAAGAGAMVLCDRAPQRRGALEAGLGDALWLGAAQATALIPGVSRSGATLAAARARGFRRRDARALSAAMALPVITGAVSLKVRRLRRGGFDPSLRASLAIGSLGSAVSAFATARLARSPAVLDGGLGAYAAYRLALAGAVLWRLRSTAQSSSRAP